MIKKKDASGVYFTADSYVGLEDWEIIGDVPCRLGVRKVYIRQLSNGNAMPGGEMRTVYVRATDTEAECRKADEGIEDQIMNMRAVVCDRLERTIRATFRRLQHDFGVMRKSKLALVGGSSPAIYINDRDIAGLTGHIHLLELDFLLKWYVSVSEEAGVEVNNIVCMPTDPLTPSPLPSIH